MAVVHDLGHTKAALERAERCLSGLRDDLKAHPEVVERQYRCMAEVALCELDRRYSHLSELYHAMVVAPKDRLPALWQRFRVCYDDYLQAAQEAKCALAWEQYRTTRSARPT